MNTGVPPATAAPVTAFASWFRQAIRGANASVSAAFLLIAAIYAAGTLAKIATKPLWHDELFTLYVAGLPNMASIWRALARGVDTNPPLYVLLVHWLSRVCGSGAMATRLPAAIGFGVMCACLFIYVRPRFGLATAATAAVIPIISGAGIYAYEGRTYGVVLGCAAAAILFWQRVNDDDEASVTAYAALTTALLLAFSSHYYAVLLLVPLGLGQVVHDVSRRRPNWAIWGVFIASVCILFAWIPLLKSTAEWLPHFWAKPTPAHTIAFYDTVFSPLALPLAASGVCAAALALSGRIGGWRNERDAINVAPHEAAAAIALAALPLAGFVIGRVTGVWTERYAISAVIGLTLSIAVAVNRCGTVASRIVCGAVLSAFVARELSAVGTLALRQRQQRPPAAFLAGDEVPIVVSHALTYLPLNYYSPEGIRRKLVYLLSPPESPFVRSDTGQRGLSRLASVAPLRVERYDSFTAEHERFRLYGPRSWLIDQLISNGADITIREISDEALLCDVTVHARTTAATFAIERNPRSENGAMNTQPAQ